MSPALVTVSTADAARDGFLRCWGVCVSVWGQCSKMVCPAFSEVGRVAGREDNWLAGYCQGTHLISLGEVEG